MHERPFTVYITPTSSAGILGSLNTESSKVKLKSCIEV